MDVTTLTWGAVVTLVAICFVLGAAPIFAVRIIGLLYPKGHPRRAELLGEMTHVGGICKTLEQWRWLGQCFATGVCEGAPLRLRELKARLRTHTRERLWVHEDAANLLDEDGQLSCVPSNRMVTMQVRRWGRWVEVRPTPADVERILFQSRDAEVGWLV